MPRAITLPRYDPRPVWSDALYAMLTAPDHTGGVHYRAIRVLADRLRAVGFNWAVADRLARGH